MRRTGFSRRQKRHLDRLTTELVQNGERDAEGRAIVNFDELTKRAEKILGITDPAPMQSMMNRIMKELQPGEDKE